MDGTQLPMFSWVQERRNQITFGIQAFPRSDDPQPVRRVMAVALLTEEVGLDAFYYGDHPGHAPEPHTMLAAIAVQTRRIRLGSVVICAGYRHPALLARMAADVDLLSEGRFVLGLGIGWNEPEFGQLGQPFLAVPERQRALEETLTIIRGVWSGEPYTFQGDFYTMGAGRPSPPPRQRPSPPLIIAGGGYRTLRQVAEWADACNFGPSERTGAVRQPDHVRERLDVLWGHCEVAGRSRDEILPTHFTSWLMLGETETAVEAKVRRYFPDGLSEEERATRWAMTPEQAVARYQELASVGMRHFVVQTQDASDLETIHLLGEAVGPYVRLERSA